MKPFFTVFTNCAFQKEFLSKAILQFLEYSVCTLKLGAIKERMTLNRQAKILFIYRI